MQEPGLGTLGILLLVCGIGILGYISGAQGATAAPPNRAAKPPASALPPEVPSPKALDPETFDLDAPRGRALVNANAGAKLLDIETPATHHRARGLCFALAVGILNGTVMVPLRLAPEHPYRDGLHALDFAVCFGPAALVVMILCFGGYVAFRRGRMPALQARTCLLPGVLSGILWSIGNACATLADLQPLGLTVGYPMTQCCLLVGGMWGIFFFGEMRGLKAIGSFFAAALVVIAGAALLGIFVRMPRSSNAAYHPSSLAHARAPTPSHTVPQHSDLPHTYHVHVTPSCPAMTDPVTRGDVHRARQRAPAGRGGRAGSSIRSTRALLPIRTVMVSATSMGSRRSCPTWPRLVSTLSGSAPYIRHRWPTLATTVRSPHNAKLAVAWSPLLCVWVPIPSSSYPTEGHGERRMMSEYAERARRASSWLPHP